MALVTTLQRLVITVTQDVPGYDDVIWDVEWQMNYTDPDLNRPDLVETSSGKTGFGHSADELANFVPVADVTDEMLKDWVIAAIGTEVWDGLTSTMSARLADRAANEPVLERYYPAP